MFPSDTVISMRLLDSAAIFTAEIVAIINGQESIKTSAAFKYIIFIDSVSCLQAYMKLEYPLIGMMIRRCTMLALGIMKRQTAAKSTLVFA